MTTELPTAGRSRFVASDRTARPWTTLAPIASPVLRHYRFRLPSAIRPHKVPPSRCKGWRSLTRPRVEEFEVATGARPSTYALPLPNPDQFEPSCSSSASIIKGPNADIVASDTVVRGFGDTYVQPVNVSGGLESKGHPIAATGIANIWEIATHLRGEAGPRQIDGAKIGLAHVIGLGSSCAVHILQK
jgi:hypothetical protein